MNRKQKAYYKNKLKGFQRMIWDLELQRFTNGSLREQAREEYDQLMSRKDALEKQEPPKDITVEQAEEFKNNMDNVKKEVEEKINSLKEEMDMYDVLLHGKAPSSEDNRYIEGINNKIDTVRSTIQKTKDYINGRR